MRVTISRIDKTLPLPRYETAGAVAFDLVTRETTTIPPGGVALIPSNVIVRIPEGYALYLSSRSSTARKKGLVVPLGIIDNDFCGPHDELRLQAINFTGGPVTVERGERVGQAMFVRVDKASLVEEDIDPEAESRGGFGTTG